jgi:anthranilate phosphoribosyltransferase
VHGDDGLDELSTTTTSQVLEATADPDGGGEHDIRRYRVDPADLGLAASTVDALRGGDADANAAVVERVLGGERGPHRDIVCLNAAAALVVAGLASDLAEGVALAQEVIDHGRAAAVLDQLRKESQVAAEG